MNKTKDIQNTIDLYIEKIDNQRREVHKLTALLSKEKSKLDHLFKQLESLKQEYKILVKGVKNE